MSQMKSYPSDLSDAEWAIVKPLLPSPSRQDRPRVWSRRLILDGIFYAVRSGCAWRMPPHDFPPWKTVYHYFRQWHQSGLWQRIRDTLRRQIRMLEDRHPHASAAIIDSQSVRTTESGGPKGYDAGKNVSGRKRHLLVDTQGFALAVLVTEASKHDGTAARTLLAGLDSLHPRLQLIWADGAYGGEPLRQWCKEEGGWQLEVIERDSEANGFVVLPRRWVVERTFAWLGRQ